MKVSIGENLKNLRLKKNITQEHLAEAFGISAQAVSRWENNTSYPDITLLAGLAMFYDTSVDAIVGMDEIRKEESLRRIHGEINSLVISGQTNDAVKLIRNSLKTYPNDKGLLMSLGETLAHMSDDTEATEEAIRIAERVLATDSVSMKARATTTANLFFLYLKRSKTDQAKALVQTLPHIWESREIMMPEIYNNDEYINALRKSIEKALVFFYQKINAVDSRSYGKTPEYIQLGVNFESKEEIAAIAKRVMEFICDN